METRMGEVVMLEEMQAEAEVREALYGQTDEISDIVRRSRGIILIHFYRQNQHLWMGIFM